MRHTGPACVGMLLVARVAWLAPAFTDDKTDRLTDEAAIKQIAKDFESAWNKHDMDALASLFVEDADFVHVAGSRLKGRKEVKDHHAKMHAMQFKDSVFAVTEVQVKFLKPDLALAHIQQSIKGDK